MTGRLRVGVIGAHGYGRRHIDRVLTRGDELELVAVADPRGGGDLPEGVRVFTEASAMFEATAVDLAVVSTPIPYHADLAVLSLEAGAHVLLEKPPVVSTGEHRRVDAAARVAARSVQVGFQSLASAGIAAARELIASGGLGELNHIGVVGLWSRSEEYWRRSPWAGRRRLPDGRVSADGAATNPLSHAIATALAIAGAADSGDVCDVRTDMRRADDIDTDDTSSLVIELTSGTRIAAALSVTAPLQQEPYVLLRGSRGHALYFYTRDLLQVHPGGAPVPRTYAFERSELLDEMIAHIRRGAPLSVPLAATGGFTRVLEAIVASPEPVRIAPEHIDVVQRGGEVFRVVRGIEELVERAAWEGQTFAEAGVSW
ncbi:MULTISPECIES: Gfo/Idh/MocA family oxidoreductase [Microbacterium]|uniref:Gfo/Idh/MocA family protein n=1 Tax=Microbacterium TaxID=33882 RepID=UPI000D65E0B8|nr:MULTISPECIES: Gfo/Idh/MocA family oxidoreductase [Microbacterium]